MIARFVFALLASAQVRPQALPPGFVRCPGGTQVRHGQTCPVADFFWFTYFGANGTSLSPEARSVLREVWTIYRAEQPHWHPRVILFAHADAGERRPGPLSLARAAAVRRALIDFGVPENVLEIRGYGDTRPIVENPQSPEKRSVQIVFYPSGMRVP